MSLRLKIHLLVGALVTLFVLTVFALHIRNVRDSVREEVVAANRVAHQLLNRTVYLQASQGTEALRAYLQGLGRVRANDIRLLDAEGAELYRSPPSPYKTGRDAPEWFAHLILPTPSIQSIEFPDGKLVVQADASRAAVDAWDQFSAMALMALALLVAVNAVVYWVVGRTVKPFGQIVEALGRIEAGHLDVRLMPLPGREAGAIGAAFNRMAAGLAERIEAERRASRAESELSDRRDLARWIDRHLEQERKLIARELHDELGQSVTAIRSLALSVAQRTAPTDPQAEQAAKVIADESSRLYDAMHGLIPRLAPLVLDAFGLADALRDLAERTRVSQPQLQLEMAVDVAGVELGNEAALALYRAAQEGITNALRHGKAGRIVLGLHAADGGAALDVRDDGEGLAEGWRERASADGDHYGLRWLDERVQALGGRASIANEPPCGARLQVWVPGGVEAEETKR